MSLTDLAFIENIGEVIPLSENSGLIIQSSFGKVVLFAPEATKYNPCSPWNVSHSGIGPPVGVASA